jgi:hypothetical protein
VDARVVVDTAGDCRGDRGGVFVGIWTRSNMKYLKVALWMLLFPFLLAGIFTLAVVCCVIAARVAYWVLSFMGPI